MRSLTFALLLALAAPFALRAQSAYLVKDINTIAAQNPGSSWPYGFFRFGSRTFFGAFSGFDGWELWSTDGTAAGTSEVADINRGFGSSFPSRFIILNGTLIFNATDPHGEELWTTDGTSAGTRLLADINPAGSSRPGDRIVYHGRMIFAANDGVDGNELWITDGTPGGTKFFKDLVPGPAGSDPRSFVVFHDVVYFGADGALWKSDGTDSGTVKVKSSPDISGLTVAGSLMFFVSSGSQGSEQWVSDGTEAGTHITTTRATTPPFSSFSTPVTFGDRALFAATDSEHGTELWVSDGTDAGTHLVRDLNPGPASSMSFSPPLIVVRNEAFFFATTDATGNELWKTDGSESGTTLVRDINPGPGGGAGGGLTAVGDTIYFPASATGEQDVLWATDGTAAGTRQVAGTGAQYGIRSVTALVPPTADTPILTNIDGTLYFAAADALNGTEPWKSDRTDAGTTMLANLEPDQPPSSDILRIYAAGNRVYFTAWDGTGAPTTDGGHEQSLWRSDGTSDGTLKLTDPPIAFGEPPPTKAGDLVIFKKDVLWSTDGTPAGTGPVKGFESRFPSSPTISFILGDKILAAARTPPLGDLALWVTSAAPGAPAVSLGSPGGTGFAEVAGRALYFVDSPVVDSALWITDGTPAGTRVVVSDVGARGPQGIVVVNGLFFFATSNASAHKLWKSDGTFEGTVVVKSLPDSPFNLVPAGRNLFFFIDGQLWVSDGTDAGTHSIAAVATQGTLAATGDRVVFTSTDSTNGAELWVSDGTAEGTRLLRDIFPGPRSSVPSGLTSAAGLVYFSASDDLHGNELWSTDGTPEGTRLVADIEPGLESSFPQAFARAGDRLYFIARTAATGDELWALPLAATPLLSIGDIRVREGDSGTSTARFTVTLSSPSAQTVTAAYATSDGSAVAGSDYAAASGTVTFAPGETSKNIDVSILGDALPENDETFFVTLRNPAGAAMDKSAAFAIIEDDDQFADLAVTNDFSSLAQGVGVGVANNGPRAATDVRVLTTATPGNGTNPCLVCPRGVELASGAKSSFLTGWAGFQQYLSVTATGRERDPQPSNNSTGWMSGYSIAMDALYLTPGSAGNVWFTNPLNDSSVSIESSNPAVISVPASIATPNGNKPVSFIARGVSVGKAAIRLFTPAGTLTTLAVDVVAPGTKPRFPAIFIGSSDVPPPPPARVRFDTPLVFNVSLTGTAPFTGETATGLVTILANGHEAGRTTLTSGNGGQVSFYAQDVGPESITFSYAGDANFLPVSLTSDIVVLPGSTTFIASAERHGQNATIHVFLTGSPAATPTGTIIIPVPGQMPPPQARLIEVSRGVAEADVTLTNVTAEPLTLLLAYSGDAHYNPQDQNVRLTDGRRRAGRH